MKLIKAYIRYRKAEEVHNALKTAGFCCMTFVECEGTGQYSDQEKDHISEKYPFASAYRVIKLEIVARDEHIPELIKTIKKMAGQDTGEMELLSFHRWMKSIRSDPMK